MLWQGLPCQLMMFANARQVDLYTSPPMLRELRDVLLRSKFKDKIAVSGLSVSALGADRE